MTTLAGLRRGSLRRRIVLSVVLGLAVILLLFGVVALWTVQQSTAAAYDQRVDLAQALSQHVTDVLDSGRCSPA
jgi:hypothetical protein